LIVEFFMEDDESFVFRVFEHVANCKLNHLHCTA
jgi:hypothetical protein